MSINIIVIKWALTCFVCLGIGYLFGANGYNFSTPSELINERYDDPFNMIIAMANSLSAIIACFTIYILLQFRDDWKRPKLHDSSIDFGLSLDIWSDSMHKAHFSLIGIKGVNEDETCYDPEYNFEIEKDNWHKLQIKKRTYDLNTLNENESITKSFNNLIEARDKILRSRFLIKKNGYNPKDGLTEDLNLHLYETIESEVKMIFFKLKSPH